MQLRLQRIEMADQYITKTSNADSGIRMVDRIRILTQFHVFIHFGGSGWVEAVSGIILGLALVLEILVCLQRIWDLTKFQYFYDFEIPYVPSKSNHYLENGGGLYGIWIGTLSAPNGPPWVETWPCEPSIKHKRSKYVLLTPDMTVVPCRLLRKQDWSEGNIGTGTTKWTQSVAILAQDLSSWHLLGLGLGRPLLSGLKLWFAPYNSSRSRAGTPVIPQSTATLDWSIQS